MKIEWRSQILVWMVIWGHNIIFRKIAIFSPLYRHHLSINTWGKPIFDLSHTPISWNSWGFFFDFRLTPRIFIRAIKKLFILHDLCLIAVISISMSQLLLCIYQANNMITYTYSAFETIISLFLIPNNFDWRYFIVILK